MEQDRKAMRRLIIAINNIDELYYNDTAKIGIKESLLWLLYALDNGQAHSQKEICAEWGFPKSTLNTTIKQAESEGYLTLSPIPGKRRECHIELTPLGQAYTRKVLAPIYQAEAQAFTETVEKYSTSFIDALAFLSDRLKLAFQTHVEKLEETSQTGQKGKGRTTP